MEFGEEIIDCAVRETKEECALSLTNCSVVPFTANSVSLEHKCHYITIFVRGETVDEPVNNEPDKCQGWEWVDLDAIPSPIFLPLEKLLQSSFTL